MEGFEITKPVFTQSKQWNITNEESAADGREFCSFDASSIFYFGKRRPVDYRSIDFDGNVI